MPVSCSRLPFTLLLLACVPGALTAQDRRLAERLDSSTAAGVQHLVDSARAAGLPSEPLVQKALEGKTMGASPARIQLAVEGLFGQLVSARGALGRDATEAELTAGAGALRAGLAPGSLRQLHELRRDGSLAVPIAVLTDLVAEGVPADQATRAVLELARNGRSDDDFVALRKRVQTERRDGTAPRADPLPRPAPPPAADPPASP
ncbi:MAG: hypothetical protein ACREL3_06400 [Gemmatimonadales bacterium]